MSPIRKTQSMTKRLLTVKENATASNSLELTLAQNILGTTAFITAVLLSISWLYHRGYLKAFDLKPELVSYSTQDYILNARTVLAVSSLILLVTVFSRLFINYTDTRIRVFICAVNSVGIVLLLIYLAVDISRFVAVLGYNWVSYRPYWMLALGAVTFLLYGCLAPTVFYRFVATSSKYQKLANLVSWSGFLALALLGVIWLAHFMGYHEGRYDSVSTSRLPEVSIGLKHLLGVDTVPDQTLLVADGEETYVYYNLRLLTRNNDIWYVFRVNQGTAPPDVFAVQTSDIKMMSLGRHVVPLIPTPVPPATPVSTPVPTP